MSITPSSSLILASLLSFMHQPVQCGSLQKRPVFPVPHYLSPAGGASNTTFLTPSLTPLPPDSPAAESSAYPSLGRTADSSTELDLLGFTYSSSPSAAPSIEESAPVVPAILTPQVTPAPLSLPTVSSTPQNDSGPSPGCSRYEPCNLFFQVSSSTYHHLDKKNLTEQNVDVYYWPEKSRNTSCVKSVAPARVPDGLEM